MWSTKDCMMLALFAGGSANIARVYSCFTRVHVALVDKEKADSQKLLTLPDVKNVLTRGTEMQLVVGIDAPRYAALTAKTLGKTEAH